MKSRVSWEGGKRSHVSIQGLREVVNKGTAPSVTVLLSHCRNPSTGCDELLNRASSLRWEEAGDLA